VALWSVGTGRPSGFQFYTHTTMGGAELSAQAIESLRLSLRGVHLRSVDQQTKLSHMPFSVSIPVDIVTAVSHYDTIRRRPNRAIQEIVHQGTGEWIEDAKKLASHVARKVLFELVCDAHINRSQQTMSMGVVVDVGQLIRSSIEDGMELLETLFPSGDRTGVAVLSRHDPAFYALPGGRLVRLLLNHLFNHSETTVARAASYSEQLEHSTPVSLGALCREYVSAVRYLRSTPDLVFAHQAPESISRSVRQTMDALSTMSSKLDKHVSPSELVSAATDLGAGTKEATASSIARSRISGAREAARAFVDGISPEVASQTTKELFIDRLSYDPLLRRIQADLVFVQVAGNRSTDAVYDVDELGSRELVDNMRRRNASNSIRIDNVFYNDGKEDGVDKLTTFIDRLTISAQGERSAYSIPFAHGNWLTYTGGVSSMNFHTVPISTRRVLRSISTVQTKPVGKAYGTVADRYAGYSYDEWRRTPYEVGPFVVEVETGVRTGWIHMSNAQPLPPSSQGAVQQTRDISLSFFEQTTSAVAAEWDRGISLCILWNAERIVQSVCCLIGHADKESKFDFVVRPPRAWRASDSETAARESEIQAAEERLQQHRLTEPEVIRWHLGGIWDAVLRVANGRVAVVGQPPQPETGDNGAGVGINAAVPTGMMFFSPEQPVVQPRGTVVDPLLMAQGQIRDLADGVAYVDVRNGELFRVVNQTRLEELTGPLQPLQPGASAPPQENTGEDGDDTFDGTAESSDGGEDGDDTSDGTGESSDGFYKRAEGLEDTAYASILSLPTFADIWSIILKALFPAAVRATIHLYKKYIKQVHDDQQAYLTKWREIEQELSTNLDALRANTDAWNANVSRETEHAEIQSASRGLCSVVLAQIILEQTVGESVSLHLSPSYATSTIVDTAVRRTANRLSAGFTSCASEGVKWVTIGEYCDMSRLVLD